MSNSSPRYDDENINEDVFDDDTNAQLHHSSSDIKLRRTSKFNIHVCTTHCLLLFEDADSSNYPVIHRALSTVSANQTLVNNQRNALARNFRRISVNDEIVTIDHTDADASFLLPNLYELPDEIRTRVMDSLVDTPTMTTLEESSMNQQRFLSFEDFFQLFFENVSIGGSTKNCHVRNYILCSQAAMAIVYCMRHRWVCKLEVCS